jgi:hypothetical protein
MVFCSVFCIFIILWNDNVGRRLKGKGVSEKTFQEKIEK